MGVVVNADLGTYGSRRSITSPEQENRSKAKILGVNNPNARIVLQYILSFHNFHEDHEVERGEIGHSSPNHVGKHRIIYSREGP